VSVSRKKGGGFSTPEYYIDIEWQLLSCVGLAVADKITVTGHVWLLTHVMKSNKRCMI
jgi:hypothetical protein